MLFLSKLFCRK